MTSVRDIAWLAGILEGEGSFLFSCSPCITIQMADRDIIDRVAEFFQQPVCGPYKPKGKPTYRETWAVRVYGTRAAGLMMTVAPFMGARRFEQIKAALAKWRAMPGFPKAGRGSRLAALCHPERKRVGRGLCKQCYMQEWRANAAALA